MDHVLSLSYGKDSLASIEACFQLGYKIDKVVHVEVWATDTIPADLPEMVAFKSYADTIIKKRYGLTVEHVTATDNNGHKLTYEDYFYNVYSKGKRSGQIYGFPFLMGPWCNSRLKVSVFNSLFASSIKILGIASSEQDRISRFSKEGYYLPLVELGWNETFCRQWCEDNCLLSPIYSSSLRGGCWFCHNQGLNQLRLLRKNYPDLWNLLLKWDSDSPVSFRPNCLIHQSELSEFG